MATYIVLIDFTEQGIRDVKQSPQRAAAFKDAAQKMGVTVKEIYWTLGAHDGLIILDAPDEQTATAAMLSVAALGNVTTQTMRAFTASQIEAIIARTS